MLVLTRKEGESLYINENIKVTVAKICGNKVRIAIDVPRDIPVAREELVAKTMFGTLPIGEDDGSSED